MSQLALSSENLHPPVQLPDSDNSLAETAAALKNSLKAAGVAIALEWHGAFVCRAGAGDAAPEVGVHVGRSGGITGECISTGAEVSCSDTELDHRVNAAVCRQLGIRSLLSVPLHWNSEVVGVAVAMFSDPGTADAAALQSLKAAAQQIVCRVYGEHSPGADLDAAEEECSSAAKEPQVSPPAFELLNSGLTSLDDVGEFLSRPYSLMVAVVIVILLLTFGGFLIRRTAKRPPSPGGSPQSPAAVEPAN